MCYGRAVVASGKGFIEPAELHSLALISCEVDFFGYPVGAVFGAVL